MEEFFEEFFKNRRGQGGQGDQTPRRINSLGSGFIIDRRASSSPTTT